VAELGTGEAGDRLFHIFYDGTVVDEEDLAVLGGGEADAITDRLKATYRPGLTLAEALEAAVKALAGERTLTADELEVAVLSRGNGRRAFRRLSRAEVGEILGTGSGAADTADDGGDAGSAEGGDEPSGNGSTADTE
jgi:proteasome alpha subunit